MIELIVDKCYRQNCTVFGDFKRYVEITLWTLGFEVFYLFLIGARG